jgi:hypothetical protein
MQPYTFAFDGSTDCLFKWQVIPSKQITLLRAALYVVFLQQIVVIKATTYLLPD